MDQVLRHLWIGAQGDGQNIQELESHGITAVFNATETSDSWPQEVKERMPYLRMNQPDSTTIPEEKLNQFFGWMVKQRREGKTILIHCGAGVSRASTFTIAWLMFCGYDWDAAETLVRMVRPIIAPHQALKESVLSYLQGSHA